MNHTASVLDTETGDDANEQGYTRSRPENPFLQDLIHEELASNAPRTGAPAADPGVESPFLSEYHSDSEGIESFEAELHREIMADLRDEEFNLSLGRLVDELSELNQQRVSHELGGGSAYPESFLTEQLTPLQNAIDLRLDGLLERTQHVDEAQLTEGQIDLFMEDLESHPDLGNPEFEDFFKKLFKKVKKVAKKGLKIAKKVGKALGKLNPLRLIFSKLKKLVRPLLQRVLRFALNKIPARYRPLAKRLARRFARGAAKKLLREDAPPVEALLVYEDDATHDAGVAADMRTAAVPVQTLATDFDAMLAGYLASGEEFELQAEAMEYYSDELDDAVDGEMLDAARERFVEALVNLEEGEDYTPHVEEFVTAVLMGLRLGIKVIGRKRVVNFLAKLVAKLIRRFVGKQSARPLSRALVDAGLKLVSLEHGDEEDDPRAAADVVVATVEETIERLVAEAPEEAFTDEDLVSVYTHEAFEHAVAGNFPAKLVRPGLRQADTSAGAWQLRPQGKRRKRYKKYSRVLDVSVTPNMAAAVKTFGGKTLAAFLGEKLGMGPGNLRARMHIFEGIRGTRLTDISRFERGVPGLGSGKSPAWKQIHPLTRRAAGLLIPGDVGLGRRVPRQYLVNRRTTAVGQRFYYLEISGARVIRSVVATPKGIVSTNQPARGSDLSVLLDFRRRRIQLFSYLSEAAATDLATKLRGGQPLSALAAVLRHSISTGLRQVLDGSAGSKLQIVRELPAEEEFLSRLAPILRFASGSLSRQLVRLVVTELVKQLKDRVSAFAGEFDAAAKAPQEGVTIVVTLENSGELLSALAGKSARRMAAIGTILASGRVGGFRIKAIPGYRSARERT